MPTYTVTVSEKKKDINGGATVQSLTLKNEAGAEKAGVEMFLPAGQPAPVVGKPLEGAVEWDEKFSVWKFKPASRRGAFRGSSRDFKSDPVKNRYIAAENAHNVSTHVIRLAIETGRDPADLAQDLVKVARIVFPVIVDLAEGEK